jgi:hypothetical protein
MKDYATRYNVISISEVDHTYIRLILEDVAIKMALAAIKDKDTNEVIRAQTLTEIMFRIYKIALDGLTPEGLAEAYREEGESTLRPSKLIAMDSDLFNTIIDEIHFLKKINSRRKLPEKIEQFTPLWLAIRHTNDILPRLERAKEFLFDEEDLDEIMAKAKRGII